MKSLPQPRRFWRFLLPVMIGLGVTATMAILPIAIAPSLSPITSRLTAYAIYDPASYGIPYQIAGFQVLAVKTDQNTACMEPNTLSLVLQSGGGDPKQVYEALQNIPALGEYTVNLDLSYANPWDPQRFISQLEDWNAMMVRSGCLKLGPIILITPTAIPYEKKPR